MHQHTNRKSRTKAKQEQRSKFAAKAKRKVEEFIGTKFAKSLDTTKFEVSVNVEHLHHGQD